MNEEIIRQKWSWIKDHIRDEYGLSNISYTTWIKNLEIADIAPKDWNSQPLRLALADLFPEEEICYTGQDYLEHLEDMAAYAADYPSVRITRDPHIAFRNMEILICFGKFVLVSKENLPTIHFMIHHPKLVRAFEQFIPEEL